MKKFLIIAVSIVSFTLLGADAASAASKADCVCGSPAVAAAPRPAAAASTTAQAPAQSRRSFSVEPAPVQTPAYRAPAGRSYRRSGPLNPSFDAGRKIRGDY